MRIVCAWCAETIASGKPDDAISHGICPACSKMLLEQHRLRLDDLLDQVPVPVVAFKPDLTALCANSAARRNSQIAATLITDLPVGNIIECVHAVAPEGCGRTIHCSGCTIRRMIADTHRDGRARQAYDVTQPVRREGTTVLVRYCLSTQKVADTVLLIVEDARDMASAALLAMDVRGESRPG